MSLCCLLLEHLAVLIQAKVAPGETSCCPYKGPAAAETLSLRIYMLTLWNKLRASLINVIQERQIKQLLSEECRTGVSNSETA